MRPETWVLIAFWIAAAVYMYIADIDDVRRHCAHAEEKYMPAHFSERARRYGHYYYMTVCFIAGFVTWPVRAVRIIIHGPEGVRGERED